MMLATNFGVYEICMRHAKFIDVGDDRNMEIRARDASHLEALRDITTADLGETLAILDGTADFPYRAFISRTELAILMAGLAGEIDYVQFKKDAVTERLHRLLSSFWTSHLTAYPRASVYSQGTKRRFRGGGRGSFMD